MTPDYRALCAELVDDLEAWVDGYLISDYPNKSTAESFERIARARAALAVPEPKPVGPTKLELEAIELKLWDKHRTKGYGGAEFMYDNDFSSALDEYRAVLARWGRS
jgi:hypothetical protein